MKSAILGKCRFICERQRLQRLRRGLRFIGNQLEPGCSPFYLISDEALPMPTLKHSIREPIPSHCSNKGTILSSRLQKASKKTDSEYWLSFPTFNHLHLLACCLILSSCILSSREQPSQVLGNPTAPSLWSEDHPTKHVRSVWLAGIDWNLARIFCTKGEKNFPTLDCFTPPPLTWVWNAQIFISK